MKQRYEAVLSLGSWIYTAALVGLCGGIVFGILSALWSVFHGEWAGALLVLWWHRCARPCRFPFTP